MCDHEDAAGPSTYRVKTSVLFAADGRSAVLLRRGPRLHHQLIRWDLRTDAFERGQWMKGAVGLCDLNVHGDKLIYWARQFHASAPKHDRGNPDVYRPYGMADWSFVDVPKTAARKARHLPRANEGVWTAVSTPPYFSAFAIWPCLGHWTGGGWFENDATLVLQETAAGLVPKVNRRLPAQLRVRAFDHRQGEPRMMASRPNGQPGARLAALLEASGMRLDWMHVTASGRLLYGADGAVFSLRTWRDEGVDAVPARAERLADFRADTFTLVTAPEAAFRWSVRRVRPKARRVRG